MFLEKIKSVEIEDKNIKFVTLEEFWATSEKEDLINSMIIMNTQNDSLPNVLSIDFNKISNALKKSLWKKIQNFTYQVTIKYV